jgi:hypothetical protein
MKEHRLSGRTSAEESGNAQERHDAGPMSRWRSDADHALPCSLRDFVGAPLRTLTGDHDDDDLERDAAREREAEQGEGEHAVLRRDRDRATLPRDPTQGWDRPARRRPEPTGAGCPIALALCARPLHGPSVPAGAGPPTTSPPTVPVQPTSRPPR